MDSYRGIRALVTGASSGIGRAIAADLARRGANLVLTARSEITLERIAAEIREDHGVDVEVIVLDLLEEAAPQRLYTATSRGRLPIDLVVNNAGIGTYGVFGKIRADREKAMIRLNVEVPMALTALYLPPMVKRGTGGIINVASVLAFLPSPYMAAYGASKAFLLSFSESVAAEVRGTGVRIMALCPGATRTEFHQRAGISKKGPDIKYEDPSDVARHALDAALAGRNLYVSGRLNWLVTQFPRFAPRKLTAWIMERVRRPKGV
ncbi:MAG: SDR family oxidoreductase [Candidatus Eisenbacteria bacterium]|uniref:SDR family oxidoreductase n=1 Tax=Eiseniibacteriota bacterium TaxID=2212470 RepID=A0A948W3F7_UNCEI|nr:SDR family oxidoreductase [Candidatus Eisenbacteria bacterium]MBU1950008.1 SDR family oxidoreductase [Candidatus Eisenbacteria bacterium]MBU2691042.1 SDR family oxidoreductase [Candidatus Eisenbacteria bacterium]